MSAQWLDAAQNSKEMRRTIAAFMEAVSASDLPRLRQLQLPFTLSGTVFGKKANRVKWMVGPHWDAVRARIGVECTQFLFHMLFGCIP